jgi:hypothetical protein
MTRRLLTLLLAAVLLFGLPAFAQADESTSGGANTAIAINKKDGNIVAKTSFSVRHVMGDVVDQSNAAVAFASCVNCSTAAVAVQIVLVESNPSVVRPQNIALAINELCSSCLTIANALQFVVSTDGPANFDDAGRDAINNVRDELHQIRSDFRDGNLTLDELQSRVATIRAQIREVLANHIVAMKNQLDDEDGRAASTTASDATTSSATADAPLAELAQEAEAAPTSSP